MSERELPVSEVAERASLGALIFSGVGLVFTARRMGLVPEAWFVPAHQAIAWALWRLADEARPTIDLVTVQTKLEAEGNLTLAGGATALEGMVDAATPAHGEYYLDEVLQKWRLRNFIETGLAMVREAYGAERADALVQAAPQKFLEVLGPETKGETNVEVGRQLVETWEAAKRGEGKAFGLETPWEGLTELLCGLEPGITILAGRPSMGKTTIEDEIACHAASNGVRVGRFTLDGSRKELLGRAICRKAGVSLPKLKSGYAREDQLSKAREALEVIGQYPMWINDTERDIRAICAIAREWRLRHGVELITVDFAQLVGASDMGKAQWDANTRVAYVSRLLKALGLEFRYGLLLLSQLRRLNPSEKNPNKPPTLEDLRDSGSLEQDCHKALFVYQDMPAHKEMEAMRPGSTKGLRPTVVDVQKHKDGETGTLEFWFHASYFRFEEAKGGFDVAGQLRRPEAEMEHRQARLAGGAQEWEPGEPAEG